MRRINLILTFPLIIAIVLTSCNHKKLIKDKSIRSDIEDTYNEVFKLAEKRANKLFKVFDNDLTVEEEEGLRYYFASMPLSDLADYDGDFYLENIRTSLKARNDFAWSTSIPEHIYLHFVLPIRVNNENLDSFRIKYYDELFSRVKDFTEIESAALEINHWCHEKVTYQGADIRTSAPMATVLSTRGRCGEESTFTVAALRTVGIPARQVYVPRWAHSDDNHAWVEVWIDGEWKYLGACEPEPVLNCGWFTEAASRAMLVYTRSYGKYYGKENIVSGNRYSSEINNLALYANTKMLVVKVIDTESNPVVEADVEFKLYNYAEFYTVARVLTNREGFASLQSGLGSLLVWCSKKENYGFKMVSLIDSDTVQIVIGEPVAEGTRLEYNLEVPTITRINPNVSPQEYQMNRIRLAEEDNIRENYKSSWIDSSGIAEFAETTGYNADDIRPLLLQSMGNYSEIMKFLESVDSDGRNNAIALLNVLADKDLRDTPSIILLDHHTNSLNFLSDDYPGKIFNHYILNPRVANEIIKPWRRYLQDLLDPERIDYFRQDPGRLVGWIEESVILSDAKNYYNVPITPVGSIELGLTDNLSRKILFVACCRSYGIPGRLEEGTGTLQYYKDGIWTNVSFNVDIDNIERNSKLTLTSTGNSQLVNYYTHFTLGYREGGKYETLKYDYGKDISEFNWPLYLPPGNYMLVSGNRLNDAEILSDILFFSLTENEHKEVNFSIRYREFDSPVLQTISPEHTLYIDGDSSSLYNSNDRATVIAWINHEKEPTKHFLNELKQKSSLFDEWSGNIILINDSTLLTKSFVMDSDNELPKMTRIGFDSNYSLLKDLFPDMDLMKISLPVVLFVNPDNEIIFKSEGYQLGISDQLLTYIRAQKN